MHNKETIKLGSERTRLVETLSALTASGIDYAFLGDYPNLPDEYEGTDIDILVSSETVAKKIFHGHGWALQTLGQESPIRAFALNALDATWIIVDLWNVSKAASRRIAAYILAHAVKDDAGLLYPPEEGHLAWKLFKYIHFGAIRRRAQFKKVIALIDTLEDETIDKAILLLHNSKFSREYLPFLEKISDRRIRALPEIIWNDILGKKDQKNARRLVYRGQIHLRSVLLRKEIVLRLLSATIKKSTYPLPIFAVVGNDGSGKSTFCNRLKQSEFYKTDPVHVSMKRKDPSLPLYSKIRPQLKRMCRGSMKRYQARSLKEHMRNLCDFIPFWFLEIGDFIDRYLRFRSCQVWARAGFGIVLFERYVTDRLRGEYPGPRWSLFPLEQFFPKPDAYIYFDVEPEESLQRKPEDNHTLETMREKRKNYSKLMERIEPKIIISGDKSKDEAYATACAGVMKVCRKKQAK